MTCNFFTPTFCSVICNGNIIDLSSSIWFSVVFYHLDSSRFQCDLIRHLIQKCLPHLAVSFLLNILIRPISTSMLFPKTLSLLLLANPNLTFPRGSINASSAMISQGPYSSLLQLWIPASPRFNTCVYTHSLSSFLSFLLFLPSFLLSFLPLSLFLSFFLAFFPSF